MNIKTTKMPTRISRVERFQELHRTRCPYCKKELMMIRNITIDNGIVGVSTKIREIEENGEAGYGSHRINECRVKALMTSAGYKINPDLEICFNCKYFESGTGVDWMDMAFAYTKCGKYLLDLKEGRNYSGVGDISPVGSCGNWEKKEE